MLSSLVTRGGISWYSNPFHHQHYVFSAFATNHLTITQFLDISKTSLTVGKGVSAPGIDSKYQTALEVKEHQKIQHDPPSLPIAPPTLLPKK